MDDYQGDEIDFDSDESNESDIETVYDEPFVVDFNEGFSSLDSAQIDELLVADSDLDWNPDDMPLAFIDESPTAIDIELLSESTFDSVSDSIVFENVDQGWPDAVLDQLTLEQLENHQTLQEEVEAEQVSLEVAGLQAENIEKLSEAIDSGLDALNADGLQDTALSQINAGFDFYLAEGAVDRAIDAQYEAELTGDLSRAYGLMDEAEVAIARALESEDTALQIAERSREDELVKESESIVMALEEARQEEQKLNESEAARFDTESRVEDERQLGEGEQLSQLDQESVQEWTGWLETKDTVAGKDFSDYEILHTGPLNYLVYGGGDQIWSDGIRTSDAFLLDTKYIGASEHSPYVPSSNAPDFLRQEIEEKTIDELERYQLAINDEQSLARGLEIITNNSNAADYFQGLMDEHSITGRVSVRP